MIFVGAVNSVLGLLGMIYLAIGQETNGPGERIAFAILSPLFFCLGLYLVAYTVKMKLILSPDRIEQHAVKTVRSLRREEIAGWRAVRMKYHWTLLFRPRTPELKNLRIILMLKTDEAFNAWIASLPNLDEVERAESTARIIDDQSVGVTAQERSQRLAGAQNRAKVLNWIAGIAAARGFFYPRPYQLAMATLGIVPLVAIAMLATGGALYQVRGRRNDARADLSIAFLLPGLVMALRGLLDFNLLEWMPIIKATIAGTVLLTILLASRGMRESRWAILPFSVVYLFGAMTQANTLLDRSKRQVFPVRVLNKRISNGNTTTYYFQVEPWGSAPRRKRNQRPFFYIRRRLCRSECMCVAVEGSDASPLVHRKDLPVDSPLLFDSRHLPEIVKRVMLSVELSWGGVR
jgi:hypothetical protein